MTITLDHNPATAAFVLTVPRGTLDTALLMREYGLNKSIPDSGFNQTVLYTRDPMAAASFWMYARGGARDKLGWIYTEMAASRALVSGRHVTVPSDRELIPFQVADVDYIMRRPKSLDADEPGLGKTPTAIVVANEMQAKRVIVVCPGHIRDQWLRRIKEWSVMRDPFCYAVKSSKYGVSNVAHWTVISYELARNPAILRALTSQHFDLLIVDEVHYAKDVEAKRSRALFGYHDHRHVDDGVSVDVVNTCLMDVCEWTLTLSGTPIPNRPDEAYVLLRNLNHESIDWMSHKAFRERFNPRRSGKTESGKVWVDEEEGRLPELQNRLRAHIMCRHLMKDVRHQLAAKFPDPIYDLIYLEETHAIKMALEAEKALDLDPNDILGSDFEMAGAISTVRKEMGLAMAPGVADYLRGLLEGGEKKLVVFTWHTGVTDVLVEELADWNPVWTDGRNTSKKDRIVQKFVKDPTCNLLIGNILTLGTGTDDIQHVANHCLFSEPDWVDGNNVQAVKRLARLGQLTRVLAEFFVVRDSMAEFVLGTSLRKSVPVDKTLDRRPGDMVDRW
jgi:SWI/SNF-related matrix-associated actin-dependent regulator 1 of chromatin subfamily A